MDTFLVRIDKETEIDGSNAPVGFINIRGIGAQFKNSAPFTSGYQLFPQFLTDLISLPAETADLSIDVDEVDETAGTYTFEVFLGNANPNVTLISLEVDATSTATEGTDFTLPAFAEILEGCGDSDTFEVVVTIIDDGIVEGPETIVLNLVSDDAGTVITTGTLTLTIVETTNITDLLPAGLVKAFPNPGTDFLRVESSIVMSKVSMINLHGQVLREAVGQNQQVDLNTQDLPAGIYLLRVETAEGMWMQRWMKN